MATATRRIYTLAEAADELGCHVMRLRRAEARGLIPRPRRDELGHRVYDENDLNRLRKMIPADFVP